MNELALLLERVRQARHARSVAIANERHGTPCAESRLGCVFRARARVFDSVSGLDGAVLSSTIENILVTDGRPPAPAARAHTFKLPATERVELVSVLLDNGQTVIRSADELIAR